MKRKNKQRVSHMRSPLLFFCGQAIDEKSVCYEIFKSWSEQRVKRICSCKLFQEIDC